MRRHFISFFFASLALFSVVTLMWPVEPAPQLAAANELHMLLASQVLQIILTITLVIMIVGLMFMTILENRRKSVFEGWDTSLEGNGGYPVAQHTLVKRLNETLQFRRLRLIRAPSTHVHKT